MNWVTIIGGVALFLAPFVFGYTGTPLALWTSLILGAVIAYLGFKRSFKVSLIGGLVAFVAPWVLGFSRVSGALWSCLLLGGVAAVTSFFAMKNAGAGSAEKRS